MARDMLRVDGVPPETKQRLQESASGLYGQANASLLVRELIAAHLSKSDQAVPPLTADQAEDRVRIQIRVPRVIAEQLDTIADDRFSKRNYYLNSIILAHLGRPQLQGDEIEVLRRSNYELAKIGTNLNQVAKAFNILVKMQGADKLPEVGKKIASLRREITEHTGRVLRLLEAGTTVWEAKPAQRTKRARKR